ncbi:hypothetical protein E1165_14645 [Micromonospora sp. KC723]|nr:hypothetical protein E1165_14645 [Micromonospora sp. KC723]
MRRRRTQLSGICLPICRHSTRPGAGPHALHCRGHDRVRDRRVGHDPRELEAPNYASGVGQMVGAVAFGAVLCADGPVRSLVELSLVGAGRTAAGAWR